MDAYPLKSPGNGKWWSTEQSAGVRGVRMVKKLGFAAIAIFTLGCVCDHFTTAYGLTLPNIMELNENVLFLMGYGVWHIFEFLVMVVGIGSGIIIIKLKSCAITKLSTIALVSGGLIRFGAGLQNLTVIINSLT